MADEHVEMVRHDDAEPVPARQIEIQEAIAVNRRDGRAPCAGVSIRSKGELAWMLGNGLARNDQYGNTSDHTAFDNSLAANLSGADLHGAILGAVDLQEADLTNTKFRNANLSGANLRGANLCGADFRYADLTGSDLSDTEMDIKTDLKRVLLDSKTLLGDVKWNGVSITRVDWSRIQQLGDESDIYTAHTRQQRISTCQYATRAYRSLAILLRDQGLAHDASRFRLREQQLERRTLWIERKYAAWLFSALLDIVAGYGERPGRIVFSYLAVVIGFAAAYFVVTNFWQANSLHLAWYEALVLSVSSFHGRGFFPNTMNLGDPLGDPIAIVAAIEAVIGLFIELILIATFSRRFLGN